MSLCPGGTSDNSPAFQRWDGDKGASSPDPLRRCDSAARGTAEKTARDTAKKPLPQPSLRDLSDSDHKPSVETLGYSQPSLRDDEVQRFRHDDENRRTRIFHPQSSRFSVTPRLQPSVTRYRETP